jgi:hypothetical protein
VRASTSGASAPTLSMTAASLSIFQPVRLIDVIDAIRQRPDKCCASNPVPTYLLKVVSSCVAAFLTELFNRSLQSGRISALVKSVYVTPLIKKLYLDASDVQSYRSISNLTVMSKLLERLAARQLIAYLKQHDLLPKVQSAYRLGHSTETAVLRVLSDVLLAIDSGDVAVLAMLDLSAAFDTVDHQILLQRLQISFGINDLALSWFQSYLKDRMQHVRLGSHRTSAGRVLSGIPQVRYLDRFCSCYIVGVLPKGANPHFANFTGETKN